MINSQGVRSEKVATLAALIKDAPVALLTTSDRDGNLCSRPLLAQSIPFDGQLAFVVSTRRRWVSTLHTRQAGLLTYGDEESERYVVVNGVLAVERNPVRIERFWRPGFYTWFPEGPGATDLRLLTVAVTRYRYWNAPSSPSPIPNLVSAVQLMGRSGLDPHETVLHPERRWAGVFSRTPVVQQGSRPRLRVVGM